MKNVRKFQLPLDIKHIYDEEILHTSESWIFEK